LQALALTIEEVQKRLPYPTPEETNDAQEEDDDPYRSAHRREGLETPLSPMELVVGVVTKLNIDTRTIKITKPNLSLL